MHALNRRQFLAGLSATAVSGLCFPKLAFAETAGGPTVYVVHGQDPAGMLAAGIARFDGWRAVVKTGQRVTLKVNAAWASRPEQGGNTSPGLVAQTVRECLAAGAAEVVVPENPCSRAAVAFPMSGIEAAVKEAGGRMYCPAKPQHYRALDIPRGVSLKQAEVVTEVLDCGCLINMPVAKNHSAAILTLALKNWMGSVKDRGYWHGHNLHQCIADFNTRIRATLNIIDALRIMTTGGPQGPGKLAYPGQLIFGRDPVAVDAYATTLFGKQPFDIPHIKIAHAMGVGCGDLSRIRIVHVQT